MVFGDMCVENLKNLREHIKFDEDICLRREAEEVFLQPQPRIFNDAGLNSKI